MDPVTITLPASWRDFIAEQVAKGGHHSAEDYIETLLRDAEIRNRGSRVGGHRRDAQSQSAGDKKS